jgi:hypothetical protein
MPQSAASLLDRGERVRPIPISNYQHEPTQSNCLLGTESADDDRNTLEKETFGCVTEAELREYEGRRDRICKLSAELIDREAAA